MDERIRNDAVKHEQMKRDVPIKVVPPGGYKSRDVSKLPRLPIEAGMGGIP